jgi:hypothetical protein
MTWDVALREEWDGLCESLLEAEFAGFMNLIKEPLLLLTASSSSVCVGLSAAALGVGLLLAGLRAP